VLVANLAEGLHVVAGREGAHRVAAEERELALLAQRIPEFLETDGGLPIAFREEQAHHLSVHSHTSRPALGRLAQDRSDDLCEALGIGPTVPRQPGEKVGCIQEIVLSAIPEQREIQTSPAQPILDAVAMRRDGDDHAPFLARKARSDEAGDDVHQEGIVVVELNQMLGRTDLDGVRARRDGLE
jgi:hypothetical protein